MPKHPDIITKKYAKKHFVKNMIRVGEKITTIRSWEKKTKLSGTDYMDAFSAIKRVGTDKNNDFVEVRHDMFMCHSTREVRQRKDWIDWNITDRYGDVYDPTERMDCVTLWRGNWVCARSGEEVSDRQNWGDEGW